MIRQEQDEAYQQSLKADREKQLKREAETRLRESQEKAERERKEKLERLHTALMKLKSEISSKLPPEPMEHDENIVRLVFKLPDGTRVKRNFFTTDKVRTLYWFVFSIDKAPLQFKMTTNFPKRDLPGRPPLPEDFNTDDQLTNNDINNTSSIEPNCESTLEGAQLTETQIIFVYDLEA